MPPDAANDNAMLTHFAVGQQWYWWYRGMWHQVDIRAIVDDTHIAWRWSSPPWGWTYELPTRESLVTAIATGRLHRERPARPWGLDMTTTIRADGPPQR
jgi:hypothetical protein